MPDAEATNPEALLVADIRRGKPDAWRRLIDEYEGLVGDLARLLGDDTDAETLATAVELASLPDVVRGYEDVKLGNVERYHSEMARLRSALGL